MNEPITNTFDHLVEQYLGLESMETTEMILDLCGANMNAKALSLLKQRLQEEEAELPALEARGYVRMQEKGMQLIVSLKHLIAALEATTSRPEEGMV